MQRKNNQTNRNPELHQIYSSVSPASAPALSLAGRMFKLALRSTINQRVPWSSTPPQGHRRLVSAWDVFGYPRWRLHRTATNRRNPNRSPSPPTTTAATHARTLKAPSPHGTHRSLTLPSVFLSTPPKFWHSSDPSAGKLFARMLHFCRGSLMPFGCQRPQGRVWSLYTGPTKGPIIGAGAGTAFHSLTTVVCSHRTPPALCVLQCSL